MRPREWLSISSFIAGLLLLAVVNFSFRPAVLPEIRPTAAVEFEEQLVVRVEGLVDKPGDYRVVRGTTLQELFDRVGLRPESDVRRYKMQRALTRSQTITIRERPMIRVFLSGAVQRPGAVHLPKGLLARQLSQWVDLTDEADLLSFAASRRLKADEELVISIKK